MRKFLYSRWFFLFLAVTCLIDLFTDIAEDLWGWSALNHLSIVLDVIILFLALWIFVDLQGRRPRDGGNSRR
jgi:hypothetical protein